MLYVNFKFDWRFKPNKIQLEQLQKLIPDGLKLDDDGYLNSYETYTADIRQLMSITNRFKLEETSPSALLSLADQVEQLVARFSDYTQDNQYNQKCNVHISNVGLLSIRTVKIECDYCTDRLQLDLDNGWHILAICPQPDSHRPDYVLGKG